jgi:hypothetical protein
MCHVLPSSEQMWQGAEPLAAFFAHGLQLQAMLLGKLLHAGLLGTDIHVGQALPSGPRRTRGVGLRLQAGLDGLQLSLLGVQLRQLFLHLGLCIFGAQPCLPSLVGPKPTASRARANAASAQDKRLR